MEGESSAQGPADGEQTHQREITCSPWPTSDVATLSGFEEIGRIDVNNS